jgi:molybdenum cofactor sulfurtransferase
VQPDFVVFSFYKMLGYPTGLGALLVRRRAAHLLNRVYFGGGTVDMHLGMALLHLFQVFCGLECVGPLLLMSPI